MKNRLPLQILYLLVVPLLVASCVASERTLISSNNNTLPPTQTDGPTSNSSPTGASTLQPTQLSFTQTALPTLALDEARNLVGNLLENNAGCRLPCWWGIHPGITLWQDAKHFLSQLDNNIYVAGKSKEFQYANVQVPTPREVEYAYVLFQDYVIRYEVVDSIKIYNYDFAPAYYLSHFLSTYGPPSEIHIRTFRNADRGSQPFLIDLFYPDQGILMEYSGGMLTQIGDKLQNCFQELDAPFIYLWSPDRKMTFAEAVEAFLDTRNLPYPRPLFEATGMDIETFYQTFINPKGPACLETPMELWPEQ